MNKKLFPFHFVCVIFQRRIDNNYPVLFVSGLAIVMIDLRKEHLSFSSVNYTDRHMSFIHWYLIVYDSIHSKLKFFQDDSKVSTLFSKSVIDDKQLCSGIIQMCSFVERDTAYHLRRKLFEISKFIILIALCSHFWKREFST